MPTGRMAKAVKAISRMIASVPTFVSQENSARTGSWPPKAKSATTNFQDKAKVYYGDQSKHEFFERTTWHSGQHVRQYKLVLETLGITPDKPLPETIWEGLPMPVKVWDDEKPFAA